VLTVFSFQSELGTVESQMNREVRLKSSSIKRLVNVPMNNLDNLFFPALVLAVGNCSEPTDNSKISLASIFQYIYMAHKIHGWVSDEDTAEANRQYPVLVGDFLLGQSFVKICDFELYPYLRHFVKVIKTINEGIIYRWRLKNKNISILDYRLIISKERASLTALAGKLGADICGIQEQYRPKLEEFGYNLGMAWAAWEEQKFNYLVQEYLLKAKANIHELREHFGVKTLQEFYDFFMAEIDENEVVLSV